ncbi:GNAT family N-acetyltransferase [Chryseobacterium sp. R2A-55]|uniref:GNAT family N-acetyltransferase n=1 Tax=Chryseobacterium sp. R2A-55 TaxID=2744445 RepID=UPI001F160CCE|nr:GNAT family N-acetyltransferase [Chryseobacterium sp. R2A-55]
MQFLENPNIDHLQKIESWLIEESQKTNEGFYCNWQIIMKCFHDNQLLIYHSNQEPIAFACWDSCGDSYADIDIFEVHPHFRNKGIGKEFYNKIEFFFKSKNYIAIKLFCSPIESETFWKKMNFIKFPKRGYAEPELTYYKPLIKVNNPTQDGSGLTDKLELWDLEPYEVTNQTPRWTWKISETENPVLQPCNPNWKLRLTKNGKIIRDDKVKYFDRESLIELGPFLLIHLL